jgi:hypothetical protein
MDRTRRGLVGELGNGGHDPAPSRCPVVIASECQLVSRMTLSSSTRLPSVLEHQSVRPAKYRSHQNRTLMKAPPGPPMTLGNAAKAKVRLIVWFKACA